MKEPSLQDVEDSIAKINFYPGIGAAVLYGLVSGLMSFMNKFVLTTYKYRHAEAIILCEVVVTGFILEICRQLNYIDIPPYTIKRARQFLLPSICFTLHTWLALCALSDLSIPMYNVLRRLLPLCVLVLGAFVLGKKPTLLLSCAVSIVVFGCIVAGLGDLSFHLQGYLSAIFSVLTQSCYLVYVQKTGVESNTSTLGILHLNSINCIPLLLTYTSLSGILFTSIDDVHTTADGFVSAFMMTIAMGCLLNYTLFLCATMNSALTTSLVGVIKGVITTVIGFFTFGGVSVNVLTLSGILLNTVGAALYVYSKYRDQVGSKLQQEFIPDHDVEVVTKQDQTRNQKIVVIKVS